MERKPNILFIVVDALRARNLGCYGYSKQTSPNIDNLAKEGVLFENAYSCAPTTHPSFTSIFSGRYPLSHGIVKHELTPTRKDIQRLNESGTIFLPEVLKSNGYTTLAVDWLGRWHKRGYDYYSGILSRQKLRLYWLMERFLRLRRLTPYVTHWKLIDHGEVVTKKAIDMVKKVRNKRFFLLVHYWDAHIPYNPPKQYVELFINCDYGKSPGLEEICNQFDPEHLRAYMRNRILGSVNNTNEVLARYDGAIAFVDHQIKRLLETLDDYGISEKTFVVITSDHGESLTEHGIYFGHHGLYDVTIHVPLIFRYSGLPEKDQIKSFVQHVDIVPTLYDVLGITSEALALDGKSLIPLINDEIGELRTSVYVEEADTERKRAIRTSEYKYICALSEGDAICKWCGRIHGGAEELYDLNRDPEENYNVIEEDSEEAEVLKEELGRWVEFLSDKKAKKRRDERKVEPDVSLSAEEEKIIAERLKALGYF